MTTHWTGRRAAIAAAGTPSLGDVMSNNPAACRYCPHERREHMQRWTKGVGWHQWTQPTQEQIKTRMLARHAAGGTR